MRKNRLLLAAGLFLLTTCYAQEDITITTYYPSPSGSYNELGTNKLAVDITGVAVPTEYAAMQNGDAHIGRSLIIGAGGGSGFAYDEGAVTGDGTLIVKNRVGIGTTNPQDQLEITGNLRLPITASAGGTTAGIIKIGSNNFIHSYGTYNVCVGLDAGNFLMTGSSNIAIGRQALANNTTGSSNVAVGNNNLRYNTTGSSNVAVGALALENNTSGQSNVALGTYALKANTSGQENVALGAGALKTNTAGNNNTAVGNNAGSNNTGSGNVFLGMQAGYSETGSNKLYIANNSLFPLIYGDFANKRVGIGTTDVSLPYALNVNGTTYSSLYRGPQLNITGTKKRAVLECGDQVDNGCSFMWYDNTLRVYVDGTLITALNNNSGTPKTFVIDHPLDKSKYLVHATLEGPEGAVYYRGTAKLVSGTAEITLPNYFEGLTHEEERTVLLTNINGFDKLAVKEEGGRTINAGKFIVYSDNQNSSQKFNWEVKAVRKDVAPLVVEPDKKDIDVRGFGPYTYAVSK